MKRILSILLTCMFIIGITACGNNTKQQESSSETESVEVTTNEVQIDSKETETVRETEENISMPLLDEDVYVEYRGIYEYSDQSWIINLYLENNTDCEIYLDLDDVLVNGYCISLANGNKSIPAGSKYLASTNFDYIIDTADLSAYGITEIETLAFNLRIKDDWAGNSIYETPVNIDVNKIVTQGKNDSVIKDGEVLLDKNDVYVSYCGIYEYSTQSWIINLYLENNRDSSVYLDLDDVLVNGYNVKLSNGNNSIPSGSKYLAGPNFDYIINTEDLSAYGIEQIETITFNLRIKDSWAGDAIYETPVSLNMK